MTEQLKPNNPRFKQTSYYSLFNELLVLNGVFRGVNLEMRESILDIGCGDALDLFTIAKNKKMTKLIVGLDIKPHAKWKKAIRYHYNNLHFIVADAHHLPFVSGIFDFVFLKDVLHHVPKNHSGVINGAFCVVKNGGIFKLIEANRYHINPILVLKNDKSHDHFTLEQLHSLMKSLSFDEIDGFELFPAFSNCKKDIFWNSFVMFFWFSTTSTLTRRFSFLYLKIKEKLLQGNLTYYALTKRKRETC